MFEPEERPTTESPTATPEQMRHWHETLQTEAARRVPGQQVLIERLLITILCGRHSLLTSPPGMAKWRAIEVLGRLCGLPTLRLRGSNDLTSSEWSQHGWDDPGEQSGLWMVDYFDELPPKLRNQVFAAMEERGRESHEPSDLPWTVFAARAPRSPSEGTLEPVRDSRDDRFLFQVDVPFPPYQDEFHMLEIGASPATPLQPSPQPPDWRAWRAGVWQVAVPPPVAHYALRLVRATRIHSGENPDFIYEWVQEGAGPRAALFLLEAARCRAALNGRPTTRIEDVGGLAAAVLRHRVVTNNNARQNGIDVDRVIRRLLTEIPPRVRGDDSPPKSAAGFTLHDWVELE